MINNYTIQIILENLVQIILLIILFAFLFLKSRSKDLLSRQEAIFYFWLTAMLPMMAYTIVNTPVAFNSMSFFDRELGETSLFPFLVCEILIPVICALTVNIFIPVSKNIYKSFLFAVPVFIAHINHLARQWLFPIFFLMVQNPTSPNVDYVLSRIVFELSIGGLLLISVAVSSWLASKLQKSKIPFSYV